jgi:hypothetical protein
VRLADVATGEVSSLEASLAPCSIASRALGRIGCFLDGRLFSDPSCGLLERKCYMRAVGVLANLLQVYSKI